MKNERISILGTGFDNVTGSAAAETVLNEIRMRGNSVSAPFFVITPNPLMVMNARSDASAAAAFAAADLSLPDGTGIIGAAKRAGTPLPERVPGIATAEKVIAGLAARGGSVFLFGGKPGNAVLAAENLVKNYPGLVIAGVCDGYSEREEAAEKIAAARPDFLCVCLGSPAQEKWIADNRERLRGTGCAMALGGSVDVWAGKIRRAPRIFIALRLEWLWRMLREPRRFRALPVLVKFRLLTRCQRQ